MRMYLDVATTNRRADIRRKEEGKQGKGNAIRFLQLNAKPCECRKYLRLLLLLIGLEALGL